jgi:hypothetical protein
MNKRSVNLFTIMKVANEDEVSKMLSKDTLDEIKSFDASPMFIEMSLAQEGDSTGALYTELVGEGKKIKDWFVQLWPVKAIKSLVDKANEAKSIPVYNGHDTRPANERLELGKVIKVVKKKINDITNAVGLAYIYNTQARDRIRNGEFNICSIEATCLFSEAKTALRWVVEQVVEFSGVAIGNREKTPPAFKDSNILAVITAMSESGKQETRGDSMETTLQDVKKYIETNKVKPDTLFSIQELTSVPAVVGAVKTELQEELNKRDAEISNLKKEMVPFKKQAEKVEVSALVKSSKLLEKEETWKVDYIQKTISVDLSSAKSEEEKTKIVDGAVKAQLQIIKEFNIQPIDGKSGKGKKTEGKEKDKEKSKEKEEAKNKEEEEEEKEEKNEDGDGDIDYTDAKKNELIPF